jgi:Fur family zinc uptake transcriptional regulator
MRSALIRHVEEVCRQRGLRLTRLRADVLRVVARSTRPLKAYDVLERIRESKAVSAPPTAYRALDFLLEHGFIHKLETINAYVACHAPESIHTGAFLICDRCQAATELMDAGFEDLLSSRARRAGFIPHPRTQTLEIHGLCERCASGTGVT